MDDHWDSGAPPAAPSDDWGRTWRPAPTSATVLDRALRWSTTGLTDADAARAYRLAYEEVACSPDLAAHYGYALGYWEGCEEARQHLSAEHRQPVGTAPPTLPARLRRLARWLQGWRWKASRPGPHERTAAR